MHSSNSNRLALATQSLIKLLDPKKAGSTDELNKLFWIPDESSKQCYECNEIFTTFRRKHHCRICGQIFCSKCCHLEISGKIFGFSGTLRTCNFCCAFIIKYSSSINIDDFKNNNLKEQLLSINDINDTKINILGDNILSSPLKLINPIPSNNIFNSIPTSETIKNINKNLPSSSNISHIPSINEYDYRLEYLEKFCLPFEEEFNTSEYFILPNLNVSEVLANSEIYFNDSAKNNFPISSPNSNVNSSYSFLIYLSVIYKDFIHPVHGIKLKTNRIYLKLYSNTFTGLQLLDWLLKRRREITSKIQAQSVAQAFLDFKYILSATDLQGGKWANDNPFKNMNNAQSFQNFSGGDNKNLSEGGVYCYTSSAPFEETSLYRLGVAAVKGVEALGSEELEGYISHNPILMTIDISKIGEKQQGDVLKESLSFQSLLQQSDKRKIEELAQPMPELKDNALGEVKETTLLPDYITRSMKALDSFDASTYSNIGWVNEMCDNHLWELISQCIAYKRLLWEGPLIGRIGLARDTYDLSSFLASSLKTRYYTPIQHESSYANFYRQFLLHRYQDIDINQQIRIKCIKDFPSQLPTLSSYGTSGRFTLQIFPGIIFTSRLVHKHMFTTNFDKDDHDSDMEIITFDDDESADIIHVPDKDKPNKNIILDLKHPTVLMIKGPIEFMRGHNFTDAEDFTVTQSSRNWAAVDKQNKLISLEPVIMQERDYLKAIMAKVKILGPDLVLVQGIVSHMARQLFIDAGMPLVYGISKRKLFEDIALLTGSDIVPSGVGEGSQFAMLKPRLGLCKRVTIEKLLFDAKHPTHSSSHFKHLVFLEACPSSRFNVLLEPLSKPFKTLDFCTIVIRQSSALDDCQNRINESTIYHLKQLIRFSLFCAHHLQILRSLGNALKWESSLKEIPKDQIYYPRTLSYQIPCKLTPSSPCQELGHVLDEIAESENKFEHLMKSKDRFINSLPTNQSSDAKMNCLKAQDKHELYVHLIDHLLLSINPGISLTPPILDDALSDGNIVDDYVRPLLPHVMYDTAKWSFKVAKDTGKHISRLPSQTKAKAFQSLSMPLNPVNMENYIADFRCNYGTQDHLIDKDILTLAEISLDDEYKEAETLFDCFDVLQLQKISFLFSSFVSFIKRPGDTFGEGVPKHCITPRIITASFYREHDIDVKTFLSKYCFNQSYNCPGNSKANGSSLQCKVDPLNHVRRFVHNSHCLDVVCYNISAFSEKDAGDRPSIWMTCRTCYRIIQWADDTSSQSNLFNLTFLGISFASFLELIFYKSPFLFPVDLQKNHQCSNCSHNKTSCLTGSTPPLPYLFFRYGESLVAFVTKDICVGTFSFPPSSMRYIKPLATNLISYKKDIEFLTLNGYNIFNLVQDRLTILKNSLSAQSKSENTISGPPNAAKYFLKIEEHFDTLESERNTYRNILDQIQIIMTKLPDDDFSDHNHFYNQKKPAFVSRRIVYEEYDFIIGNLVNEAKALLLKSIHYWNVHFTDFNAMKNEKFLASTSSNSTSSTNTFSGEPIIPTISSQLDHSSTSTTDDASKVSDNINNNRTTTTLTKLLFTSKQCFYEPLPNPFKLTEHFNLPFSGTDRCRIVVSEEVPSSIIAYSLSSLEYKIRLNEENDNHNNNSYDFTEDSIHNPSSASQQLQVDSCPLKNAHCEITFTDSLSNAKFACKIYYASEFAKLRAKIFPYPDLDYCRSLATSSKWYSGGGKSGSRFWKTGDDRFLVKEIFRLELQSFLDIAPSYMKYVDNCSAPTPRHSSLNPDGSGSIRNAERGLSATTLARIVGAYRISFKNALSNTQIKQQDLIVIENLFYDRPAIEIVFDLKGSLRNRFATSVMPAKSKNVNSQNNKDYSETNFSENRHSQLQTNANNHNSNSKKKLIVGTDHSESSAEGKKPEERPISKAALSVLLDENFLRLTFEDPLYVHLFSKVILMSLLDRDTAFLAEKDVMDYSLLVAWDSTCSKYIVGIVDYIHTFTWDKKLEMVVKRSGLLGGQGKMPTIISPAMYRQRFLEAINSYFLPVPDHWFGLSTCSNNTTI